MHAKQYWTHAIAETNQLVIYDRHGVHVSTVTMTPKYRDNKQRKDRISLEVDLVAGAKCQILSIGKEVSVEEAKQATKRVG